MAKQQATPDRTPKPLAVKLAALADIDAGTMTREAVAQKYSCSTAILYNWQKLAKEGRLAEPGVGGPKGAPAETERKRQPAAFKLQVLADYHKGVSPRELAEKHGIGKSQIYKWANQEKNGLLAKGAPSTAIVARTRTAQTITFESPSGESFELALLRRRNEKLKRISKSLIELLMEDL